MTGLRFNLRQNGHNMLVLLLAVLGMQALVPAGHMVLPTSANGIAVAMCPTSHPLARMLADRAVERGGMDHAAMDHAAMGGDGVDHVAMGHVPAAPGDDAAPSTARGDTSCAFSAIGFGALGADKPVPDLPLRDVALTDFPPLPDLALLEADRLRPPLRAPPRKG